MVRLIAFFVGLAFVGALFFGLIAPREETVPDPVIALHKHPIDVHFQQDGPLGGGVFGTFDRAQLQRGFQVYKEVCSACHSLHRVAFRDLRAIGFSEAEVKAIAKTYEIPTINPDTGEPATRPGLPSDRFTGPFPNDVAARAANNNALPPDLSLIVKAREGGADYVHSLLIGYADPPAKWAVPDGLYYNPYFKALNIAMPPPLSDGQVTYSDGTNASADQMAKDVAAFLTWTAEPKLEVRRRIGVGAVIFLLILTGFAYASYQLVWADIKKKTKAGLVASA